MAPPTLLTDNESWVTSLRFTGDRAYLPLAHQVLQTGQDPTTTLLRPQSHNRDRVQADLHQIGMRCLSLSQTVENLPHCQPPSLQQILGHRWGDSIFGDITNGSTVNGYLPTNQWRSQTDRWQAIESEGHLENLPPVHLFKLVNGVFLWREDGQYYEISPSVALLAMFDIDQQAQLPLRLSWDEQPGRLDLRGTYLPRDYANLVWRLSKPDPNHSRIRLVEPQNRASVTAALRQLGCELV